jgi:hypothetical protein
MRRANSSGNGARRLNPELAAQVLKLRDEEERKWPDICGQLGIAPRYARSLYEQAKGISPKNPKLQAANAALAQCGAKRRNGEICKQRAGARTDHPGYGHCWLHGGNNPSGRKHGAKLQVAEEMAKMGAPIRGITAVDALQGLLESAAGHVNYLNGEIQRLSELSTPEAQAHLRWYVEERDRLARFAEAAMRTGVAEKRIKVEEAKIAILGTALRTACFKIGMTPDQQRTLGAALDAELRKLEAGDAAIEAA